MKVIEIGIKSEKELDKDIIEAMAAARGRRHFKFRSEVYFTSLQAVRNMLTPKRLELLHKIKEKHPHSIYALAKLLRRSFPVVLRDVELLKKHGLIKLSKPSYARRSSIQPSVNYDAIQFSIAI